MKCHNNFVSHFYYDPHIYRAGAVEQLRTHVRRLNSLYPATDETNGNPVVELYEKGYGKDAAGMFQIKLLQFYYMVS